MYAKGLAETSGDSGRKRLDSRIDPWPKSRPGALAGCVPAEPGPISPVDRIVRLRSIFVKHCFRQLLIGNLIPRVHAWLARG